ncbi:MAG TPA: hypothetical protein VFD83_00445, partial [Candidatus Polarisedimenticolia bacterium]|nr:hypothetical protein [Candidatus Polarisedimenticolia bacterium]
LLHYRVLGDEAPLLNEDLRTRIVADARALSLEAVTKRVRLLEEIAESVQSNVTIPYAVASVQHRMAEVSS